MQTNTILLGDCLDILKDIEDNSIDLVLTDPPYNIGKDMTWDHWKTQDEYLEWCRLWLAECVRVLKPNGVMYVFHGEMGQFSRIMTMAQEMGMTLRSFCIWDKGDTFFKKSWINGEATGLRSWFAVTEYCAHFVKFLDPTKTDTSMINDNPESYAELKAWYQSELDRLRLTKRDVRQRYCSVTGRGDGMLRHYFSNSQFEIPTREVWESVYLPMGFGKTFAELKHDFDQKRQEYEQLREVHNADMYHCNIWRRKSMPSQKKSHCCQKPEDIIFRLINVSSRPGDTVLDPFIGSGTTAAAAIEAGRKYIGIEKDPVSHQLAIERIRALQREPSLFRQ